MIASALDTSRLHRTYYWLPPNEDLSPAGKKRFRATMTQDIRYGRLPSRQCSYEHCNLVGSLCATDPKLHLPSFDIDNPENLSWFTNTWRYPLGIALPSRTNGHWHFYLDVAMPWQCVSELLSYTRKLIDPLWCDACLDQGQTFLRKPVNSTYQP